MKPEITVEKNENASAAGRDIYHLTGKEDCTYYHRLVVAKLNNITVSMLCLVMAGLMINGLAVYSVVDLKSDFKKDMEYFKHGSFIAREQRRQIVVDISKEIQRAIEIDAQASPEEKEAVRQRLHDMSDEIVGRIETLLIKYKGS